MIDNIDNSTGETTPPLPKGFVAIKKQEAPPLPSGFVPIKKKESTDSNSTTIPQKSVSGTPTGSSGGVNPAFKSSIPSPIPDFNSDWKEKKSVEKPKTFRLPNESDEVEMQRRGITPPPSEMLKQTANNTKDLYDLDANGNVIPEKPNKLFAGLKKQDKTKGFYQQGEELVKQNKDIQNGFSEKTTFELDGGKLIPKTTVKDFKTSEGIDKEIENNDLNLDHPYLYYSTFDKENQPKDTFVESNFGENKLADLGINTADFDGFLNKKGYKAEFLDKEANGLFEGKGADLTGGYNIQLAKEIQKQRLLDLYMQDINSRDFAKRKLNQEKGNLGKLGADREQLNTQYTLFDSAKVGDFYEKEMPILTQKLKERDAENKKIYDAHKNGDAGFFYGTKQVLNSGWNGFLDRVNQTSSTMLDKIGLDSGADELRLLNEERQVQRPNTRDVGYASGRTTTYDGVKYLVTNDGQIIDQDKKIRVTDLFFKPTYDSIVNKSKSGEEDSVFSFQGSAIQAGGVLGDMIVQVALQRGVGLASGATVKAGSLLSKIPISKSIGSAIIAQSALGYSQGLEQTYKAAIDAGIDEKTAKVLATDAAQRMAGLYAITAPLSPQTKAIQAIFGAEGKELIKKAINAYSQAGKKGFVETFKGGIKVLAKNGAIFTEEGGKEVFQENIQQYGENYSVNSATNREAGRELVKETISGDEFVNTSILSFASGGLMTLPGMFSSTDKLKTLQQLSKDPLAFEKNLRELVSKGVFTNDKADVLRKDVKIYSNQSHKIPKNLNKDIAMDVMSDLEDISQLELKKKGLDKSFHEELDAEIETKRASIKAKMNEVSKKPQTNEEVPTATNTDNAPLPTVPENYNIVDTPVVNNNSSLEQKSKEASEKIKRKDLFSAGGSFSNQLGESGVDSVPTNHTEINGIEFVEFSNPNTGTVDVVMSGTSDTDFVGYYRIYENGKPTDKWSSKFENQSRNKENFKTMIGGVQSMLPEGHQYTETTSISTDGLRVWEQQLSRGYELQTDENGNLVTNEVAINGDAIVNELGIDVNQGNFDNISVTNNQQFQSVKKALLPYLQKFGLNESNIRNVNGTVEIDLPVLRKTKKQNEQTPPTPEAQPQAEVPQQAEAEKVAEVSTVEDVVATSVEKKTIKQLEAENKTTLPKIPSNKIFKNEVTPLTQNQTKGVDKIIEQNKENDLPTQKIDIGLIVPTQKTVNTNNLKKTSEITEETKISEPIVLVKENGKYYVVDGHHRISNEILNGNTIVEAKVFDNEAAPETNTTTNGNVQLGASNVGESGNSKQESPVQESVSSSVDGRANKGEVSVVFKDNKELQDIGSEEQYLEHLNAIFPDSKTKKTVYHGGSLNKNDKIKKTNFFNHFFFTSSKDYAASYSKDKSGEVQTAILNIKNLVNARTLLEAEGIEVTSANLLKVTNSNDVAKELMSEGYDGVYAEDADENTKELNFDEYVVFDPEQIHILGSKKDVEMFRQHVSKSNKVDGGEVKGDAKQVIVDGDDLILNHGTPHNFDKFQLEKIGTGEGAQAFGYGLYFTDGSKIAEGYARKLSEDKTGIVYSVRIKNGRTANWAEWREPLDETQEQDLYNSLTPEERKQYQDHSDKAFDYQSPNYDIKYQKDYHGSFDDLKPNSDGVVDYGNNDKPVSAGSLYSDLKDAFGQEKATEIFKRAGVDGIKYRAKNGIGDNYNYVVFNPESITIESKSIKPAETPKPKQKEVAGKQIEPHSEVNTDVETVKKELNLNEVDNLLYDELKDTPADKVFDKIDKIKDGKLGEIETIEKKMDDVDLKMEDNGDAIDKIDEDETLSATKKKKAIAVLEKEFKDLQKQRENLESEKEGVEKLITDIDDALFHPTEDYNADKVSELINKVNTRLETRKSIKEGTNLFPEDANIPEFVAVKKELIKLTDEKTIADFNSRTAEQVKESEPIIADIKSKAKNAERISKEELEKGIADAEKIIAEAKNGAEELERLSAKEIKDLEDKSKNNIIQVPEGKGSWRKAFNEEKDAFKKSAILRRIAEKTTSESDLLDIKEASKGMPEESNILNEVNNKLKSVKPTTKERIAERIKLSDAKIDENSDVVKAKIKAFMDMFPSADINPDDYHTNGFSADAIIDMVAKAAKAIAKGGIVTSEHIKEAIKAYNTHFDDEIDPKLIEERINTKKEAENSFKAERGVSSILKRLRDGGNDASTNAIIDEIGLNYDERKQPQIYADGVNFVKEVGIAEAYNAVKNGEIKQSDTINVIYATILQQFPKFAESEIAKVTDPDELNALVKELDDFHQKIYSEFASRNTDAGQGISMINYIINQDQKIRYSLAQQIKKFKSVNNGIVPPEVLSQMKELEKRYSEANDRIEELEGLLKEAQEQKDFDNIVEEEKRQPKLSKTKREKAEKIIKALDNFEKSILKNSYSDATMITPILIQGIRATKLAIKQGVNIAEAIEKGIEGIKKELEKLGKTFDNEERFRNDLNKSLEGIDVELQQPKVTVDKNGKVRIPTEMIKDYISKGGTDLSEFATQIQESIKDEFPDITVRDIRESVANYGKKANKTRPQIVEDIQKLKSEERLRLEYEDLQNRISKEKNETKKRTLSQTAKRLKEQIKQLQDDLGVTEVERTNRSVNYTKKRIETLREKIKNNDFAKKEVKPIVESKELKEAKIEKNRVQEEFDYLSYQQELANRTIGEKAEELLGDLYDSQRVTLATGELSFVGAQGAFYMIDSTFSRKTLKNLIENFKGTTVKDWKSNPFGTALKIAKSAHSAESLIKMINTMGTANNYMDFQRLLKESPDYDLYLKMGLRLLGEDVKSQVKDDNFIGNNILNLLRIPIHLTDRIEKKELLNFKLKLAEDEKKRTTVQGYYEKLRTGKVSDKNKKTATEMFTNANPLSTFERGNNTFMNMARKELADIYIAELRAKGKNPIDHISDFKDLGSAINTITGSGNMGPKTTMFLPRLNWIMFSARYFAASWNLTPPVSLYYLLKLGNYDGMEFKDPKTWKNWKPTVAQKAFVKPMIKTFVASYGVSLAVVAMINAAIDDDDEMTEEEKAKNRAYIEYDPRSSNFMQVNSGNLHTDYFGPYRSNVVLLSKIWTRETKNSSGEIIKNGTGYGSRTNRDIIVDYLAGKANPALGVFIRNAQGKEEQIVNEETGQKETKLMYYDDDVSFGYQIKHNTYPIFVKTVKAILDEDPVLGASFFNANAFIGKNTNVYKAKEADTPEQEFLKDQEKKKELYKLPENEKAKIRVDRKLTRVESDAKMLQNLKTAQQKGLPYFISMDAALTKQQVKDMDLSGTDESVARIKQIVSEVKAQYGIEDEE